MQKHHIKPNSGFTLVELAIVLVIIGLIIGGVLVGQDMIKSAEIRATISQWERYNTALNTFRDKFGGIPGDLRNATNFGFHDRTSATVGATTGDGNGLLEDCAATAGTLIGCENAVFFDDLATAQMIQEEIAADAGLLTANHAAAGTIAGTLPEAEFGGNNFWSVYSLNGQNWFHVSGMDITGAGPTTVDTVEPIEAFNIDNKIDDGIPNSGLARAATDRATEDDASSADGAGDCLAAVDAYNTNEDNAGESTSQNCQMMIRMN